MTYSATLVQAKQETEARTVFAKTDASDVESPVYQCQSYRDQLPDVDLMRDVYGGTKTMRMGKEKYLPKHPFEKDERYDARRNQALAFNAVARTASGLVGMIFRRDPKLDGADAKIEARAENIDARGQSLAMFGRHVAENALVDGHTWLHIEAPRVDLSRTRTRADEDESALPYWINVKKSQAHNWRYYLKQGRPTLSLFAYHESAVEASGSFGEVTRERVRVLRETIGPTGPLVTGELWELQDDAKDKKRWARIEEYPIDNDRIPVVIVYANRTGAFESEPPLRDLAYEQIEHYRLRSDMQKSGTFAAIAVPYLFAKGLFDKDGETKIKWGSDGMLLHEDPDGTAKAGVIESSGAGLDWMSEQLDKVEGRMAALGLQMLVKPKGIRPETATAEIMGKSESDAALVLFAGSLEGAFNEALEIHAGYSSSKPSPGTLELNRDFHDKLLSPEQFQAILKARELGEISRELFWAMLQAGEILPEDFDEALESARLEKEESRRMEVIESAMAERDDDGEEVAA